MLCCVSMHVCLFSALGGEYCAVPSAPHPHGAVKSHHRRRDERLHLCVAVGCSTSKFLFVLQKGKTENVVPIFNFQL